MRRYADRILSGGEELFDMKKKFERDLEVGAVGDFQTTEDQLIEFIKIRKGEKKKALDLFATIADHIVASEGSP
ncbi:unnamed protein product [Dovyalis caffra]|uniref:Uncharacterized protein n=1 Tax=Dovyalis caffra TaxID=77055 RepID=A0AAV1SQ73_9ROSI|nr:unnamed protein product [Dovyalis caffra]